LTTKCYASLAKAASARSAEIHNERRHATVGRIDYPESPNDPGYLIYI
jgi:hypothetical protein